MNLQQLSDVQTFYKLSDDEFGTIIKTICEHENFDIMSAAEVHGRACVEAIKTRESRDCFAGWTEIDIRTVG